jgi:hypothetical protein
VLTDRIRQRENIRQQETAGQVSLLTGVTDADASPSANGEAWTFKPPTGPGRCLECGLHIATQGHKPDCTAKTTADTGGEKGNATP